MRLSNVVDDQRIEAELDVCILDRFSETGLCCVQPITVNVRDDGDMHVVVIPFVRMRVEKVYLGRENLSDSIRK